MKLQRDFWAIVLASFLVFFGSWVAVYSTGINTLAIQSEDTLPAMFLPLSILKSGNLYLNDYYPMMLKSYPNPDDKKFEKGLVPFYVKKAGGNYLSAFPIVTPLVSLPVYLPFVMFNLPITWLNLTIFAHLSAAFIVALSGGFLYLTLVKFFTTTKPHAALLTAIYLFCTVNLPMISQSLWQHGTAQLFTILGIYFWLNSQTSVKRYQSLAAAGFFFSVAILSRPTVAVSFGLVMLTFLFTNNRFKKAAAYVAGFIPVLLFFMWYNSAFYIDISNQGYSGQLLKNWLGDFPMSFAGVWLSPSKGILVYSPVFVLSVIGVVTAFIKAKRGNDVYQKFVLFGTIVYIHTLAMSLWKHWYGGWSFGYRMSSDVIPYLVLLLVPFVETATKKGMRVFYTLAVASFLIQLSGIAFFDGVWHGTFDKGFWHTEWLWSIADSELVFNLRRVLGKMGIF